MKRLLINSFDGSMKPIFPAIGSTITAAISLPCLLKALSKAVISLYGMLTVSFESSSGMPGESGIPSVANPDPALTRSEST